METAKLGSVMLLAIALLALPASAKTVTVTVGPFLSFSSSSVTINVGDMVNWVWAPGSLTHSTTSGACSGGGCTANGIWDSGTMNSGSFQHTFNSAGTFPYFCSIHLASMTGSVTVLPPPPTFSLSITSPATLSAFPNQPAPFTGTLTAQNGYNTPTPLSCIAGNAPPVPSPCTPNPASPTPTPSGAPFSVVATGSAPQDYQFRIMAAGTPSTLTQNSPNLTLHVVDFDFTLPAAVGVLANGASAPQNVSVSALNNFTGMVNLACSDLPAGAACNFSPAAVQAGTASQLTVTTTHTLQGSYNTVTVTGTSGIASHAHTFTLNVQGDYTLSLANPVLTLFPGQSGNFSGTLAAQDGYTGTITLACGTFDATISCTPPAPIALNNGTPVAVFSIAIATNSGGTTAPKQYVANLTATDSSGLLPAHIISATVNVVDFQLTPPAGVSVAAGNPTPALSLQVMSLGNFAGAVDLSCPANPPGFVCHFSPASVVPSAAGVNVTLVVTTPSNATTTAISVVGTSRNSGAPQEVTRNVAFNVTVSASGTTADLLVAIQHQPSQSPDVTPVGQPLAYQVSLSDKLGGNVPSTVLLTFSSPVSFPTPGSCTTGPDFISCPITTTGATPVTISVQTIVPFARTITASAFASSASGQTNVSDNFKVDSAQVRPRPFARKGLPPKLP